MKTILSTAVALSVLLSGAVVEAKPKADRGNGNGNGRAARSEEGFCPPGLRDRNPPCVPPGQARREERRDGVRHVHPVPVVVTERESEETREEAEDWAADLGEATERGEALLAAATLLDILSDAPARPDALGAALAQPAAWMPEPQPQPVVATAPFAALPAPDALDVEPLAADPLPEVGPALAPRAEPLPAPVPTPEEEAILTDVFRRAAEDGSTGF